MESALSPLGDHLLCELCQAGLTERIKVLTTRWSMIKVQQFQPSHCAPFIVGPYKEDNSKLTIASPLPSAYLPPKITSKARPRLSRVVFIDWIHRYHWCLRRTLSYNHVFTLPIHPITALLLTYPICRYSFPPGPAL
jgi:hypothetical protein